MNLGFWRKSRVAVIGGGSWGTVLAQLIAPQVQEVRVWVRREEIARQIQSTRTHPRYGDLLRLHEHLWFFSERERVFEGDVDAVIWALPSSATREQARAFAPFLKGHEIVIHATKGLESQSLKRMSEVLLEEWIPQRIGVLSGPNLADEVARGEAAASVIASRFEEVIDVSKALFPIERLKLFGSRDVIGVEWAGALKNILAIGSGALEGWGKGWNLRSAFLSLGLQEMVRMGCEMGAEERTFFTPAGVGDVIATCSSHLSRNYRVGRMRAQGTPLEEALSQLGATAEGVFTTRNLLAFSKKRGMRLPVCEWVGMILEGEADPEGFL